MEKENVIVKLSFEFVLDIIAFSEALEKVNKFIIAKQILKSHTSGFFYARLHSLTHSDLHVWKNYSISKESLIELLSLRRLVSHRK